VRSVYRTGPLRKIVKKYLDLEKLRSSGKKLLVGGVAYETGEYRYADEQDPNIVNWIMASSAFPVFFPLEKIEGLSWTDGGLTNVVPLYDALENGATEIDVILTGPRGETPENEYGVLAQLERAMDLMTREIVRNDVMYQHYVSVENDTLLLKDRNDNKIKVRVFEPEKKFSYSSLKFDPKHIRETYDHGLKVAEKVIKEK
jgi:predicted patatin/cPLA2 family phospholipase